MSRTGRRRHTVTLPHRLAETHRADPVQQPGFGLRGLRCRAAQCSCPYTPGCERGSVRVPTRRTHPLQHLPPTGPYSPGRIRMPLHRRAFRQMPRRRTPEGRDRRRSLSRQPLHTWRHRQKVRSPFFAVPDLLNNAVCGVSVTGTAKRTVAFGFNPSAPGLFVIGQCRSSARCRPRAPTDSTPAPRSDRSRSSRCHCPHRTPVRRRCGRCCG